MDWKRGLLPKTMTTSAALQRLKSQRTYRLSCGVASLCQEISLGLHQFEWKGDEGASVGLLVDAPWGFALPRLAREDASALVIVTDNPCPEYWEDLWAHRPRALLAGGHTIADLSDALDRAGSGEFFRRTPQHESPLSDFERQLLQKSSMGWNNRKIANVMQLSEGTVKNGLTRVFQKLGFENRTQAALYYWGLWHLLHIDSFDFDIL